MKNKHCHKNGTGFHKKNIFTEENMKLVHSLARKRSFGHNDLRDEFVQEGCLALIRAFETFDPKRGVPFEGYAYTIVSHAMTKAARRISQIVSTSTEEEGNHIEYVELETLIRTEDCRNLTPRERYELADTCTAVRRLVKQLPYKERVAVTLSFGMDGLYERPLTSVANKLECSVEGARKILDRGRERLRDWLEDRKYSLCA